MKVQVGRHEMTEPIPGYRLIEPLGQGGFGEVWKCEAPGGLYKAIKFVRLLGAEGEANEMNPGHQEREALQRVKTLRHPFILSLERIEEKDGELLIIMELADASLQELFSEHRRSGLIGIPREELLGYLLEAAEALDWMNFEHGLAHLDVKPHNLFVISGHVKVADFGLVSRLGTVSDGVEEMTPRRAGVTPLYAAPELLRGTLSRSSDQYSLAVVYQQLLTGTLPFWHEQVYELMMQHLVGEPDLIPLPEDDRAMVLRALSKVPEQRYSSCLEFVQALMGIGSAGSNVKKSGLVRRSGVWRQILTAGRSAPQGIAERSPAPGTLPPDPYPLPPEKQLPLHEQNTQIGPPPGGPCLPTGRTGNPPEGQHPSETLVPRRTPVNSVQTPPQSAALIAPTAIKLPGFRFLRCLNQSPLGDVWLAESSSGQVMRAMAILNFVRYDARLISHLQALRDPLLPATEVHWSSAERLIILTDNYEGTLRDRLETRCAEGHPGIPRGELVPLLRGAAEALDALYASSGILHLGIHPRNLLVDKARLRIADVGIIPLVWLPTGQSVSSLNARYCAPELFDRRPSRSADQYSLALIYAEMLTGVHPRPNQHQPRTPASGVVRRPGSNASLANLRCISPLHLDLLPVREREVVSRALSADPDNRYPSCVAFIEALEEAGRPVEAQEDLYGTLPGVIPFASLMGEPPGPEVVLPSVGQLVMSLISIEPRTVHGPQNTRYFVKPDGSWEYSCPLQILPGVIKLKVAGFCTQWSAHILEQSEDAFRLQLDVSVPRSFWERFKPAHKLEIGVQINKSISQAPTQNARQGRLTEARVRVRHLGTDRQQGDRILEVLAPQLFDSMRLYLQATQEQRSGERQAFLAPLHVYPVLPNLELAATSEGVCRDISTTGICFRVAQHLPVEQLYLHLYNSPTALDYAILAQVTRVTETAEGIEIGARFATGMP